MQPVEHQSRRLRVHLPAPEQSQHLHARYDVVRLLYWESYDDVHKALVREKQLKGWARAKKVALLERRNPHWKDLASEWYPWMQPSEGRDASTPR
ncbi:MAG: GIY-YIG nuclease family protein [Candidatus Sulfotelmatobacter sp.]